MDRERVLAGRAPQLFRDTLAARASDERFRWIQVRLAALEYDELRELILDAGSMCVPKKVRAE